MKGWILQIVMVLLMPFVGIGQNRTWAFGAAGGGVVNFITPLKIYQNDEAALKIKARYKSEPFNPPVYYDFRVTTWQHSCAWELKFTHHKIILKNKPLEVQRFSITDGFNLLTANRLWQYKGLTYSVGAGVVITHPESTIRNQVFPENGGILHKGYYLSGPTLEAALARRFHLSKHWQIFSEGRMTASYVRVPVQNGHAQLSNTAFHLLAGLGYKFGKRSDCPGS
ncbi:MAG: hypothetical protein JWQ14_2880 [Adhaeribacter sp.]|nr:hypothetical protein [Adhaeribacter sp.]